MEIWKQKIQHSHTGVTKFLNAGGKMIYEILISNFQFLISFL